jgi:hypothetical protein
MPIVYQDIFIKCNFGVPTTSVVNNQAIVQTSNDSVRFQVQFPASYLDYTKSINITYLSASATDIERYYKYPTYGDWHTGTVCTSTMVTRPVTETYDMHINEEGYYTFLLDRKFLYFDEFKTQFSARLGTIINGSIINGTLVGTPTTQVAVDPTILYFHIKKALKRDDFEVIDSDSSTDVTIILQEMIDAHAAKVADINTLGHIKVDGITTTITDDGTLSLIPADGSVMIKPDGTYYSYTIGTIQVGGNYTELCTFALGSGHTFNLSYIGVSTTDDLWVRLRCGNLVLTSEMIASGNMFNQFMFPYGFVQVIANYPQVLTLEARAIDTYGIATGEFAGGE